MKRVLALHGHSQCAHSFRLKLSAIEDACQDAIEFVYVDAPHLLMPVDVAGAGSSTASTSTSSSLLTINGQPARAWWRFLWEMSDTDAALESFKVIREVLETQGPFDGILGFSQGAALATMVTAHLENPNMEGSLLQGINHPPLQFTVLISGFYAPWWTIPLGPHRLRTPSLHIFGIHDIMVSPENMARLLGHFDSPRVEIHQGGHFIPRTLTWRRFLVDYLSSRGTRKSHVAPARSPTPPLCREELCSIQRRLEVSG
ncbi:FSH1-domain-containing protein [Roridomyces roridus]|uniref:FSH1-domain-containing protein n=1 Tax=Roridomyces roridus TaxID=1738132 RepID=A0AAD7BKX7_9AGAR|nr:FSH1-domain-containing protein [Roridomyces roridus]